MALQTRVKLAKLDAPKVHGLDHDTLIRIYRTMYLSRRLDDREIELKRQSQIFFQISSAGHEAVTAVMGLLLRPGVDWIYAYYRDRALCLMLGVTPLETLLAAVGAKDDPSSGGRQMPSHWGHPKWNIVSKSSCTGTQFVQAVGAAEATLYYEGRPKALAQAKKAPLGEYVRHEGDEIVYVSGGDGATSEGEFWESLNVACAKKLPLLYLVEDNGYAISVPVEVQTAGGSISKLVRGFPGLHVAECDGTDPIESYSVCKEAVEYCRERRGPALIHAHVTRPYSHSLSDDEKLYKSPEEREEEARRDPISKFALFLVREGILDQKQIETLEAEIDNEVRDAADQALAAEEPSIDSIRVNVYSLDVDPTSAAFEAESQLRGAPKTMVEMVALTLSDEMARDERITVFGEDVADASREDNLKHVKGKGGVFKATAGLQRKYGHDRVSNTPLDGAGLVRSAKRCDDPVMLLEHKHLYRQPYNRSENPGPDFTIPFGKARMVKEGADLSIITYGAVVHRAEVAAAQLEREGISVEIIDLRSLSPYDWEAIAATVRKTHRVIVAYEDMLSWGYGAEIAARVADELFEDLDAPVKRVAAVDTFCAYQPKLEDVILPQTTHITAAVKQLLEY